jgi:hypothetical protein
MWKQPAGVQWLAQGDKTLASFMKFNLSTDVDDAWSWLRDPTYVDPWICIYAKAWVTEAA